MISKKVNVAYVDRQRLNMWLKEGVNESGNAFSGGIIAGYNGSPWVTWFVDLR